MQKVVLAPDSYKGILSAKEVCDVMAYQINKYYPFCQLVRVPVADGGEGSIDAFMCCKEGKKIFVNAFNAEMKLTKCYFLVYQDTAVIEAVQLLSSSANPQLQLTLGSTYGIGQLILQAIKLNASKIILCLGDSLVGDCGCGMATALGAKFFDASYNEFIPNFFTINSIASMDLSAVRKNLRFSSVRALCNQSTTLTGMSGVAARQSALGASAQTSNKIEETFDGFNQILTKQTGTDYSGIYGSGASLGLGAGAAAFLSADINKGIDSVLDLINFGGLIRDADLIFTGEGSLDLNSLYGNVLYGVCKHAKSFNVPVIDIVGKIGNIDKQQLKLLGVTSVFSLNNDITLPDAKQGTKLALSELMGEILSLWQLKTSIDQRGGYKY